MIRKLMSLVACICSPLAATSLTYFVGRPVQAMRKHASWFVALLVLLVPLVLLVHWCFWPSIPSISPQDVASIEVTLQDYGDEEYPHSHQPAATVATTDLVSVEGILNVLRRAERAREHKCGHTGTITISRSDGSVEELLILPGHNSQYYEYRYGNRINRVNRAIFIEALRGIGVKQVLGAAP